MDNKKETPKVNITGKKGKKPIGSAGTTISAGYMQEEHISGLQGQDGMLKYDEMRRTDDTCGVMERATKNPIRQGAYNIEAGIKGDKLSEEIRDFFQWNFFDGEVMDKSWVDYLTDFLTIENFGFYVGAPETGAVEHPRLGWKWGLIDIGYRAQKTILRWNFNKDTKKLESVYQEVTGTDMDFQGDISIDDLVVMTIEREGENREGKSMYRNVVGNYNRKKLIDKIKIAGFERSALGVPHIKMSRDYEGNETEKDALVAAVKSLQAHKACYIMTYDDVTIDQIKIEFDPDKADNMIDKENTRMLMTILADFLMLGHTTSGSWALEKGKKSMFLMSLLYVVEIFTLMINRLMKQLTIQNWGVQEYYPFLNVTGIKELSQKEEADIVKVLIDAGILNKDDGLEDFFRKRNKYPEADLEAREERKKKSEALGKALDNSNVEKADGDTDPVVVKKDDNKAVVKKDTKEKITDDDKKDDKEKQEDEKELREKFIDNINNGKYWRELTTYEEKLDLKEITRDFEDSTEDWNRNMKTSLTKITEKYVIDLRNDLRKGGNPYNVIEKSEITSGVNDFKKDVLNNIKGTVIKGKKQAGKEVDKKKKFAEDDVFGKGLFTWVGLSTKNYSKAKIRDLEKHATASAMNQLDAFPTNKKLSDKDINLTVSAVRARLIAYVANPNNLNGNEVVPKAINKGRMDTYKQTDDVKGFQYSAIVDDATTDLCLDLDKQTRSADDSRSAEFDPPNHFGCRSIVVPILSNEKQPDFIGFGSEEKKQFVEEVF